MNGGVYEPLAVRIPRSYPITTVQFIITGGFVMRLWLSEVARCTQRGFFEATAGDCDVITTRPSGSSLADSDRTIGGTLMFPLLESKRASALSARAPRYRCDPTLYHPDMTIGGIDDEPMPCADASTRYIREIPMAYTTVCLSAFEHGAEKCRCLVLHNDRGFLPSPLAMLLVQIRVQGEGEAKLPSFLSYRLISVPATNREDKAVYTEAQPSQLKSQKDRPILSHLVPRVAQAFDTYERVEMNQAEIYGATSSRSQKCLLGTVCNNTTQSHPAAFYRQQSKLDRMNPGTTPQKATTGGSDAVLDIDTWGLSDLQSPTEAMTSNKKAESIASRCLVEPTKWYFERFLINASMPAQSK
ncbi:hypothetical protein PCH_Pc23g00760 [Penicillium rubens Wisconsin 54-1255]|uniref:Uncharacterized protein n=1 Tax=Penicillium rubens (strain ATCC 28089 / DSM 1075 / NRRL 1951 / Wisconsin 54-1255) TaxID=500485 RepID=B6HWC6_PENRW|nr:hypothetical protein PCH_Pc23g00760 [Penicillium rubens Wisconsin 54-1255]